MIPAEFIELVREASGIAVIVGEHVQLRKAGIQWVGRCPFHEDGTPSLFVHPTKNVFRCHGCGAGGGVFDFVRLFLKCGFPEAVSHLAGRAGIEMDGFKASPELTAKVAARKAKRQNEAELQRFIDDRIRAVSARHRALGRAASHAEDCLKTGFFELGDLRIPMDSYAHDVAWDAIQRYIDFSNRIEREGLADPDILRAEWEQLRAAA